MILKTEYFQREKEILHCVSSWSWLKNCLKIFIYFFNFNFPDFTEHLLASLPLSILYINIFPPSLEMLQATSTISRCGNSIFLSSCQKQMKFSQHTLGSRTKCNSLWILQHRVNIQLCYFTDCNLAVSLIAWGLIYFIYLRKNGNLAVLKKLSFN